MSRAKTEIKHFGTVPRFTNDSSSLSCDASCTAGQLVETYVWVKQTVTATLTAATIVYVVNNRTNTTRTETIFNSLPDGFTLPPTNVEGTHTAVITVATAVGKSSEVVL